MNANQTGNEYREPDEIMIPSEEGFIVIPTYSIRAEEAPKQAAKVQKKKQRLSVVGSVLQFIAMMAAMVGVMAYAGLNLTGPAGLFLIAIIGGTGLLTYKAASSDMNDTDTGRKRQQIKPDKTGVYNSVA